jgi:hypothetical protein
VPDLSIGNQANIAPTGEGNINNESLRFTDESYERMKSFSKSRRRKPVGAKATIFAVECFGNRTAENIMAPANPLVSFS